MTAKPFIHLRVHTAYSLSEGAIKTKALLDFCKKDRVPALAVTDKNNLFGALEFSKEAASAGIQPIIGCELLIKSAGDGKAVSSPCKLVLLAQNDKGYENLMALVSQSFLAPVEEPAPLLDAASLQGMTDGLIALSGGYEGQLFRFIEDGCLHKAEEYLAEMKALFPDRFYVEIQRHGLEQERRVEPDLLKLATEAGLPIVATNNAYFTDSGKFLAHDALLCIADGRYVGEAERRRLTPDFCLKTQQQMKELFVDLPEAIENTSIIAKRTAFMSPSRNPMLPGFSSSGSEEDEFARVAREGLEWRLENYVFTNEMDAAQKNEVAKPYRERIEFEIKTIIQMKFPGYFLIVSDFIRWAKEQGIPVGPGRGSGAGSLVAWSMSITDLDPIQYGLLFERFLNPERVSMPDFDVDFCQDRRDEVISYVQSRYGRDKVAQIITFGKLQARAVLRDVGRVLQLPYGQVDRICKLVPNNPAAPVTLQQAIDMEPLLQQAINEDASVKQMVEIALQLEGLYRHSSTHAAGVVIADRPLQELVPLYRDPKSDMPVVQFSMKYAEMAGLVKFDFLGLKTLTVLVLACKLIKETTGADIDLLKLPMSDKKTYAMLGQGEAIGVFQLESSGMRDTLRKLKPDSIEDIIALVSLYRPGPMDNIPTYIARKHGIEKPEYPHPVIEPILKETFGVIIYQEQVMQIAQVMAGYSLGQADMLRRAMGKKIKAEMDAQRDIFVKGSVERGVPEAKANEIFDLMAKFADYGFNKSHAAAYALIAYQTAYLKANYPVEFYTALMALDSGNTDKLQLFRQDALRHGIEMLPPDINFSSPNFSVEKAEAGLAIRYALGAIRNVGMGAMDALVAERNKNGKFKDIFDFCQRVDGKIMNRRQFEYLVKAGAFDSLSRNRRQLFESLDILVGISAQAESERNSSQENLFGAIGNDIIKMPPLAKIDDWRSDEKLAEEFSAIGFYLSAHPLQPYVESAAAMRIVFSNHFAEMLRSDYSTIKVAGVVLGRKAKVSNRGKFAFITLSDPGGSYEVSVFNDLLLNENWELFAEGQRLLMTVEGKMEESGPRLIVQSVQLLDEAASKNQAVLKQKWQLVIADSSIAARVRAVIGEPAIGEGNFSLIMPNIMGAEVTLRLSGNYAMPPMLREQLENIDGVLKISVG